MSSRPHQLFLEFLQKNNATCNDNSLDETYTFNIKIKGECFKFPAIKSEGYFYINGKAYFFPYYEYVNPDKILKLKNDVVIYKGLRLIKTETKIYVESSYGNKESLENFVTDNQTVNNMLKNCRQFPIFKGSIHFVERMIKILLDNDYRIDDINDLKNKKIIGIERYFDRIINTTEQNRERHVKKFLLNHLQLLNIENAFDMNSQLSHVVRSTCVHGSIDSRRFHKSHLGKYCLFRASEGEKVGLTVDLVSRATIKNGIISSPNNENCGELAKQIIFRDHLPAIRTTYAINHIRQYSKLVYKSFPLISPNDSTGIINGSNVYVLISGFFGFNIEDAIIISKGFCEKYGLSSFEKKEFKFEKNKDDIITIKIKIGDAIKKNNIVLEKKSKKTGKITNIRVDFDGIVMNIKKRNSNTCILFKILHKLEIGDKLSNRSGQKGVIGLIVSDEDLPYNHEGSRADIIINPCCMPSRMTLSLLYEMIFSKMSSQSGELKKDTECHINELKNYSGLNYWFCGKTGIRLKNKMMSGFVFYFSLKHKVKNKIQSRCDFELYDSLTGQPKKGRNLGRALRIGEMERNSMMARDSLEVVQSLFSSDKIHANFCKKHELFCCSCKYKKTVVNISQSLLLFILESYSVGQKIIPVFS